MSPLYGPISDVSGGGVVGASGEDCEGMDDGGVDGVNDGYIGDDVIL